jgi:hypothetical protein
MAVDDGNPYDYPAAPTDAGPGLQGQQAQIQAWYQQYFGRPASQDEINAHLQNPGGLPAVLQLIQQAAAPKPTESTPTAPNTPAPTPAPSPTPGPAGATGLSYADVVAKAAAYYKQKWGTDAGADVLPALKNDLGFQEGATIDPSALAKIQSWIDGHQPAGANAGLGPTPTPTPTTTPTPTPTPTPGPTTTTGPGPDGGPAGNGNPYGIQSFYTPPAQFDYPAFTPPTFTPPTFNAPDAFKYPTYALPTGQDVLAQDPGFAFREQEGSRAITNDASAKGILKGTGTAKALASYNSSLASQEYGNAATRNQGVFAMNRANAADDYNTLWKNTLTDYGVKYGAATDDYNRSAGAYDRNFKTAATGQGFNIDAANGTASGLNSAGNYTLGAGNLSLNSANSTFNNLLSLYRVSTQNLPTYTAPTTSFS